VKRNRLVLSANAAPGSERFLFREDIEMVSISRILNSHHPRQKLGYFRTRMPRLASH
jgi:hypothetical protein